MDIIAFIEIKDEKIAKKLFEYNFNFLSRPFYVCEL